MTTKTLVRAAAVLAVAMTSFGALTVASDTAEAGRKYCLYKAYNPFSNRYAGYVEGSATAAKQSWACNRAKDRCLKRLRSFWDKGLLYQYRCERTR